MQSASFVRHRFVTVAVVLCIDFVIVSIRLPFRHCGRRILVMAPSISGGTYNPRRSTSPGRKLLRFYHAWWWVSCYELLPAFLKCSLTLPPYKSTVQRLCRPVSGARGLMMAASPKQSHCFTE